MMEPVSGNAGLILPRDGYLANVREMIHDRGGLLIFDEVITGLRVSPGGAQEHYLISPDITVVSKAMGGGYPVSAFGASAEIMDCIVNGPLFHGGVFSGNAVVMSAAEAVLDTILADKENIYRHLNRVADQLAGGIAEIFSRLHVPHHVHHLGPLLSALVTKEDVEGLYNYRDVRRHGDFERYIQFQHWMQNHGVYFHPNEFEPMFLSTAHSSTDIDKVLDRWEEGTRQCLVR
jgi:glutamate-1-semialdehyde 2,1-aminomutase